MTAAPDPTAPTRPPGARRFVCYLGLHHFAHLRAIAESLDIAQCAARYFGTEHGHEARSAHQQTVDAVRAIARRRSEPWRLVGLSIQTTGTAQPTLEAFAEETLEECTELQVRISILNRFIQLVTRETVRVSGHTARLKDGTS